MLHKAILGIIKRRAEEEGILLIGAQTTVAQPNSLLSENLPVKCKIMITNKETCSVSVKILCSVKNNSPQWHEIIFKSDKEMSSPDSDPEHVVEGVIRALVYIRNIQLLGDTPFNPEDKSMPLTHNKLIAFVTQATKRFEVEYSPLQILTTLKHSTLGPHTYELSAGVTGKPNTTKHLTYFSLFLYGNRNGKDIKLYLVDKKGNTSIILDLYTELIKVISKEVALQSESTRQRMAQKG